MHEMREIKQIFTERKTYSDILQIPKANTTTYGLKSWRYQAVKLWNSLPNTVRTAENYGMFSNSISLNNLKIVDNLQ